MKEFRIRASACGQIMTNDRSGKGMGKTAQTYCEEWLKEQLYGRRKQIDTKYFDKGVIMEDDAIDLVGEQLGCGQLFKNEQHFENEFCTGTPDVILTDTIIDVKCSWSCWTFPLFEDKLNADYYWQGQVYMWLTGRTHYKLAYCLMDTPRHLIEKDAKFKAIDTGRDYDDVLAEMIRSESYSDVDPKLRLKVFEFSVDGSKLEQIVERVEQCRQYIETLKSKLP